MPPPSQIVRPLLAVTRSQILEYLAAEGLEFRQDDTNSAPPTPATGSAATCCPCLSASSTRGSTSRSCACRTRPPPPARSWLTPSMRPGRPSCKPPALPGDRPTLCPPPALIIDADDFSALRPWLQGAILRRAVEQLGGGLKHMSAERTREVVSALLSKSVAGPLDLPGGLVARAAAGPSVLKEARQSKEAPQMKRRFLLPLVILVAVLVPLLAHGTRAWAICHSDLDPGVGRCGCRSGRRGFYR